MPQVPFGVLIQADSGKFPVHALKIEEACRYIIWLQGQRLVHRLSTANLARSGSRLSKVISSNEDMFPEDDH